MTPLPYNIQLFHRYLKLRQRARTDIFFLAFLLRYHLVVKYKKFFHEESAALLQAERFVCILIPRGFFKTTLLTITASIYDILNNPNIRLAIGHAVAKKARAILSELADHFTNNNNLRFLFPDICPSNTKRPETGEWNQDAITVNRSIQWKEATIEALGADQALASSHYDTIRLDDLVVEQNTTTVDQIEKVDDFLTRCYPLLNFHNDTCKLSLVGNRWVPDDTYGKIEEGKIYAPDGRPYRVYKIDAEVHGANNESDWESVYPELFPKEKLQGIQATHTYSAFYRNDPIDIKNAIWKKEYIAYYTDLPEDIELKIIGAVDPAISERDIKTRSDSAVSVVGLDVNNELWALDYELLKGADGIIDSVFRLYGKWKRMSKIVTDEKGQKVPKPLGSFRFFTFETILFQKLLYKQFRLEMQKRNVWVPTRTDNPYTDKTARIMILDGLIKNKAFHVKVGMNDLETQIIRFGRPGTKVDLLDSIAQAYKQANLVHKRKKEDEANDIDWNKARLLGNIGQQYA